MPSDAAADAPRNGRANRGSVTIVAGASPAGEPPARVAGARVDIADGRSVLFHEKSTRVRSARAIGAPAPRTRLPLRHAGPPFLAPEHESAATPGDAPAPPRSWMCGAARLRPRHEDVLRVKGWFVTDIFSCRSELRNTRVTGAKIFIFFRAIAPRAASYASHTSSVCKKRVTVRTPTRRTRTPA